MITACIPGTISPTIAPKGYRIRQIIAQAAASQAAVDLLRELALGQQPERPLTVPPVPRWASKVMEAAHG